MTEALSRLNFRDLAGLPLGGGRRVRAGRIYRSEGPESFAADHRKALAALGLKLVCDLRAEVERERAPNDWADGAQVLNMDISSDLRVAASEGWKALAADPCAEGARRAVCANYAAMPAALAPHLAPFVRAISQGATPVLIHCTAGKDRTGVLVALLLLRMGAPREAVTADYLGSRRFGDKARLAASIVHAFEHSFGFVPDAAVIEVMTGVDAAYLNCALGVVERRWGSVERYFSDAGVDQALVEALSVALAG